MVFFSRLRSGKSGAGDAVRWHRALLAALFLVGAVLGYACCGACLESVQPELAAFLDGYVQLFSRGEGTAISFPAACFLYVFPAVALFFLGCVSPGAAAIPAAACFGGFSAMFAVACILSLYGRSGLPLALTALGMRLAVSLPCLLWLGGHAWASSLGRAGRGRGKRTSCPAVDGACCLRFAVCVILLLSGSLLERSVTPYLVQWAVSAL